MYTGSRSYFASTKKFYYSLFFILPFLAVYETGLFRGALGNHINGADAVLRLFFYFLYGILGVNVTRILSGIAIIILIFYLFSYLVKNRIRVRVSFLFFMLLEAMLFALLAGIIIHVSLNYNFPRLFSMKPSRAVVEQLAVSGIINVWAKIVSSVGAGIFEEFLFRFLLIRVFYSFWKDSAYRAFGTDALAMAKAIGLSSLVFMLMHVGSVQSVFGLISIFFGSILFSLIYLKRGYGIVSATHIFYDMYLMFGILA